jgi:ABC-type phosphate transport system substrate-binding protein
MEKNQALAVAAGVGAVGTLVGYLGYSYLKNNEVDVEKEDLDVEETVSEKKEQTLTSMWSKFWANEFNDIHKENVDTEPEKNETDEQEVSKEE